MIILLTNDDGFDAEGLQAFSEAMREIGEVYVVAPDQGRSCCSHAVTTHQELSLSQIGNREWTVSGTPADCVRVALRWLNIRPNWIVSGVNQGGNLGVDLHYSGTVAGAREGRLLGVPSMAISQYLRRDRARDWKLSAQRARFAFQHWSSIPLADRSFWNINLPVVDHREIELDRIECLPEPQMLHFEFESFDAEESVREPNTPSRPCEQIIYRSNYQLRPRQEGSDVARCFGGAIVATQLSIDLI